MENTVVRVYVLKDPVSLRVRYCGATKLSLRDRLRFHIANTNSRAKRRSGCFVWIDELIDAGRVPIIELLEECPRGEANACETRWITRLRVEFPDLLNISHGGAGANFERSAEFCKKLSASAKASWANATPEHRAKRVEANSIGLRSLTTEMRSEFGKRASAAQWAKRASCVETDAKYKANLAEAGKRAWADPVKRARRLAARATPEARANNSAAQKRRWADPVIKAQIMSALFSADARKQRGASTRAAVLAKRKAANEQPKNDSGVGG